MNELENIDLQLQVLSYRARLADLAGNLPEEQLKQLALVYPEAVDLYHGIRYHSLKEILEFFQECDEIFLEEFAQTAMVKEGVTHFHRQELYEQFQSLEQKKIKPRVVGMRPVLKLAIAASVLIMAGALWFIFRPEQPHKMFDDYFNIPAHSYLTRSADSVADKISLAFIKYDAGQYQEAIVLLDTAFHYLSDHNLLFFKGAAQLKENQVSQAIKSLTQYLDAEPTSARGKWYLSLGYLKSRELQRVEPLLMDLIATPNDYQQKAQDLYNKLF